MGGMITPAQDSSNKGKNSVVLYSSDGTKMGSYEKVHLFNPAGEEKVHLPGNQVEVFEINRLKICPLICYDLRFPEVLTASSALQKDLQSPLLGRIFLFQLLGVQGQDGHLKEDIELYFQ